MTNEELAVNYQADQRALDAVRAVKILLLVGISGAGKDTIQKEILDLPGYHRIITHTTRAPRANDGIMEQNGREYHFVSHEEMNSLLQNHELVEINQFGKNFYATSVREFEIAKQDEKVAVTNVDVNGVAALHAIAPNAVTAIFLLPPDFTTWKERLAVRYHTIQEFMDAFNERESIAAAELEHALRTPYYYFIINDDIDGVTQLIDDIAKGRITELPADTAARNVAKDLLSTIRTH